MKKPLRTLTWPVLLFGNALLLAGCAENGTSSATFSPDEDALAPKPEVAKLTTGPLYGSTDPMPHPVADNSTHFSPEHTEVLNLGTSGRTAPSSDDDTASPSYDFDNLEVDSPDLKGKLAVLRVGSQRSDSNLLTVFTGLKNRSSNSLPIEVETVYKDKTEQPLSDGRASWIGITLKPHEETQYRSVALSEDATDFTVRIRRAPEGAVP